MSLDYVIINEEDKKTLEKSAQKFLELFSRGVTYDKDTFEYFNKLSEKEKIYIRENKKYKGILDLLKRAITFSRV